LDCVGVDPESGMTLRENKILQIALNAAHSILSLSCEQELNLLAGELHCAEGLPYRIFGELTGLSKQRVSVLDSRAPSQGGNRLLSSLSVTQLFTTRCRMQSRMHTTNPTKQGFPVFDKGSFGSVD